MASQLVRNSQIGEQKQAEPKLQRTKHPETHVDTIGANDMSAALKMHDQLRA
jgi:hypothetical protein